jgi:glucose/arabinose dehydrogenase
LSLPGLFPRGASVAVKPQAVQVATPVAAEPVAESLAVVNMLRLPNGMAFEAVETATGTMTIVTEIPVGAETTLQTGDVLLVYAASGETLGTPMALSEILRREFSNGVTTYGFVIRRGTSTMDAEFRLGVAG